ncbi:MAG: helix-turn-helix transcriptional regulator [Clostridiales bacterium]|jgi:putative transcriptional regulator|nr:helix-turn-helix transcriptional regulator [Clostridiales bacterium]
MIVYDRLWKTMEQKRINTYVLREKYGIDSQTIRRLKNNQNVTMRTLDKLCDILQCSLEDIVEYRSNDEQ